MITDINGDPVRVCHDCGHLKGFHHVAAAKHGHPDGGCARCACSLVYFTFGQPIARIVLEPEKMLENALGAFHAPDPPVITPIGNLHDLLAQVHMPDVGEKGATA